MNRGIRVLQTHALPLGYVTIWSGRRGSNSLPPPWQGGALPDELRPHSYAVHNSYIIICGLGQFVNHKFLNRKDSVLLTVESTCEFKEHVIHSIFQLCYTRRTVLRKGFFSMENTIGKNINMFRKKQGLTQEELAKLLNVSFQAVSKWEVRRSSQRIGESKQAGRTGGG